MPPQQLERLLDLGDRTAFPRAWWRFLAGTALQYNPPVPVPGPERAALPLRVGGAQAARLAQSSTARVPLTGRLTGWLGARPERLDDDVAAAPGFGQAGLGVDPDQANLGGIRNGTDALSASAPS